MIVKQTVKELENSAVSLEVTVEKAALHERYQSVVQKYMKSLQLPGFRKGKVPASVLERKFGDSLKEESVFTTIDEAVQAALDKVEEKYRPLPYSSPALLDEEKIALDLKDDLTFSVTYDVLPQFELPAYTELEVEVPSVTIDDEVINSELETLRQQNAMVVDKEGKIEKDDIVTVDFVELDENKEELEETKRSDFVFTVGSGTNLFEMDDDVIGLTNGDETEITKTFAEDYKYSEYAGKSVTLKVNIKAVKYRDVPALDDELAQDVSEEYKTLDDLKKATKERLQKDVDNRLRVKTLEAIADKMLESVTISVPSSMVDVEVESAWRRFISQTGMGEEQTLQFLSFQGQTKEDLTNTWREDAEKSLRVQLLIEKIKEKEKFEVDEAEVTKEVEAQLPGVEDENTLSYYKSIIEDELKTTKANDFLIENNKTKKGKQLSYNEFIAEDFS
jgi:trigger factor